MKYETCPVCASSNMETGYYTSCYGGPGTYEHCRDCGFEEKVKP